MTDLETKLAPLRRNGNNIPVDAKPWSETLMSGHVEKWRVGGPGPQEIRDRHARIAQESYEAKRMAVIHVGTREA